MQGISKHEAIEKLKAAIIQAEDLKGHDYASFEFKEWQAGTKTALIYIFGERSRHVKDFESVRYDPLIFFVVPLVGEAPKIPMQTYQDAYVNGLTDAQSKLTSMVKEIEEFWPHSSLNNLTTDIIPSYAASETSVFIGHGHNPLWACLQIFLEKEAGLKVVAYESAPRAGKSIVPLLDELLKAASFAIIILTAEDETLEGSRRARQNVVHEVGLCQGRFGFNKTILLIQDGVEEFSNIDGLQHIRFSDDQIDQTFSELRRVLRREGLVP